LSVAPNLYDLGNLKNAGSLEERRQSLKNFLATLYKNKQRVLSLGGGHDWAYPDIAALLQHYSVGRNKKRCVVVNIDAHLDVRNDDKGVTSGTSFYRLLEEFNNFDLIQVGIQPYATSQFHANYAKSKKVRTIYFHDS